ncbi:hypothetical protein KSS87_013731, partial [Heliosperma pusillum]
MDAQQQQQYENQYQYQTQNPTTLNSTSQSYDSSSQIQSYDPQSSYYASSYPQQYVTQQQQQYDNQTNLDYNNNNPNSSTTTYASSAYYYPNYSTSYQTHDPNSIHPPGVPLSVDPQQTQAPISQNYYYPPTQSHPYFQSLTVWVCLDTIIGGKRKGGDGMGRKGDNEMGNGASCFPSKSTHVEVDRSLHFPPAQLTTRKRDLPPFLSLLSPNPLIRTKDMSVLKRIQGDITEVVYCSLQPGQPVYGGQVSQGGRSTRGRGRGTSGRGRGRGGRGVTHQTPAPAPSKPPPQMAWCEICRVDCITLEILEKHKNGKKHIRNVKLLEELQNTSRPIMVVNQQVSTAQPEPEGAQKIDVTENSGLSVPQPSEETVRPDFSVGGGGLKRKMKGGRGGKRVRVGDMMPQQIVPILCELCNVKCESRVIYESHIAGKKHLSTVKRYQGHKEALGEGVEALYPTIPNLPPSIPIISQTHQPVPQDAQALASMLLGQQNLRDPEAAQAAVTQLLNQHGIHDAQTLLAQLIPYLLTQSQVPGSAPLPEAGFGSNDPYMQSQGPDKSTEAEGQNGETKTEPQSLAGV